MCPHCGRDAPLVYRGVIPYCTACGGVRLPLSGPSINLAGRPSRVGGAVASAAGWLVLAFGLGLSLLVGGLLYALVSGGLALLVAGPLAAVALAAGLALWIAGRRLARSGAAQQHATLEDALLQLAEERGSILAVDAARALGLTASDADAGLTDVAKRRPERMAVDIDEQGRIWYRALSTEDGRRWARVRVDDNAPSDAIRRERGPSPRGVAARVGSPAVGSPDVAVNGGPSVGEAAELEAGDDGEPGDDRRLRR